MNIDEITYAIGRLDELTQSLSNQIHKPKTKLNIIKEYAGIISLVLALALSVFSLWDNVHTKPLNVALADKIQFRDTLKAMLELEVKIAEARLNGSPMDVINMLSVQKSFLLNQLEDRIAADPKISSFAEERILGIAYSRDRVYEKSIIHFRRAIKLVSDSFDKTDTYIRLSESLFYTGRQEEAHSSLKAAEDLARSGGYPGAKVQLASTYANEAWLECSTNNLKNGEERKQNAEFLFETLKNNTEVPQDEIYTTENSFIRSLIGTKCYNRSEQLMATAREGAILFFSADLGEFKGKLNARLSSKWSLSYIQKMLENTTNQFGRFQRIVRVEKKNENELVDVICKMQGGNIIMHLGFDPSMQLNNLNISPQIIQ